MKKTFCDKCGKEMENCFQNPEMNDSFGETITFPLLCKKCERMVYGKKPLRILLLEVRQDLRKRLIELSKKK